MLQQPIPVITAISRNPAGVMEDDEPKKGARKNFPTFPFRTGWGNLIRVRVIQIGVINRKSARFLGGMAVGRKD